MLMPARAEDCPKPGAPRDPPKGAPELSPTFSLPAVCAATTAVATMSASCTQSLPTASPSTPPKSCSSSTGGTSWKARGPAATTIGQTFPTAAAALLPLLQPLELLLRELDL